MPRRGVVTSAAFGAIAACCTYACSSVIGLQPLAFVDGDAAAESGADGAPLADAASAESGDAPSDGPPPGDAPCAGVDLASDRANCGVCGHACASNQTCEASACVDSTCRAGETVVVLRPSVQGSVGPQIAVFPTSSTAKAALSEPGAGDGDTSYVFSTSGLDSLRFEYDTLVVPQGKGIASVAVVARARSGVDSGVVRLALGFYRNGGWPLDDGGTNTDPVASGPYIDLGRDYAREVTPFVSPPYSAGPWTEAEVNAVEMRVYLEAPGRVTQAWVEVCIH